MVARKQIASHLMVLQMAAVAQRWSVQQPEPLGDNLLFSIGPQMRISALTRQPQIRPHKPVAITLLPLYTFQ